MMIDSNSQIESANIQRRFFADSNSLDRLTTSSNQQESLKAIAKEFEAIFLQMALKSMRDGVKSMKSDLLSSSALDTYEEMYDSQLSLHLSNSSSVGIADAIVRQFSMNVPGPSNGVEKKGSDAKDPTELKSIHYRDFNVNNAVTEEARPKIFGQCQTHYELECKSGLQ